MVFFFSFTNRLSICELVNRHYTACVQFLQAMLEVEQTPFTQNDHYLQTCKDKWLAKYKDARAGRREASIEPKSKRARHGDNERSTVTNRSSAQSPGDTSKPLNAFAPTFPSNDSGFVFGKSQPFGQLGKSAFGQSQGFSVFQPVSTDKQKSPISGLFKFGTPAAELAETQTPSALGSSASTAPSTGLRSSSPAMAPATSAKSTAAAVLPSDPSGLEKINSVLALLADIGYTGLNAEDLGKLNPPDKYETELHVMAEVRGYFQVSYKVGTHAHQCVDIAQFHYSHRG